MAQHLDRIRRNAKWIDIKKGGKLMEYLAKNPRIMSNITSLLLTAMNIIALSYVIVLSV